MKFPRIRHSLSLRLLVLTICVILFAEILVFLPGLMRERRGWLNRHLRDAQITTLALAASGDEVPAAARNRLLQLSGSEMIRLREAGRIVVMLAPPVAIIPEIRIDVEHETTPESLGRAIDQLFRTRARPILLVGQSTWQPETRVELIVDEAGLLRMLHLYAGGALGVSLLIAGSTGLLIYLSVSILLVRPVRRITRSIASFRADPERSTPLDDGRVGPAGGEIATAGRELAAMQRELRAALWRNARLAALGTAMAKVSHDVRGILSSAMLAADRLSMNADPKVQRSAETILRSIDRATELVRQTLAYTRDGPPPLEREPVGLRALIEEAAEGIAGLGLNNEIDPAVTIEGDRVALLRVFGNLLRNAREAGARRIRITGTDGEDCLAVDIADDGPGLPAAVEATLFRPFTSGGQRGGSGLGLAIARDLTRAHGGDVELLTTGAEGTVFRLRLPAVITMAADLRPVS